jgi:hypothetical protein
MRAQQLAAEETQAVLEAFEPLMMDLFPLPRDRFFALGFLAAEMSNMSNTVRKQILKLKDGVQRLRVVLQNLEEIVGMAKAQRVVDAVLASKSQLNRDLVVGDPELPAWARSIRKGMEVEYYWNEEWGWCRGQVIEDPITIMDEIILTVFFLSDGHTHRLPFRAEEKVRWRPPQ